MEAGALWDDAVLITGRIDGLLPAEWLVKSQSKS